MSDSEKNIKKQPDDVPEFNFKRWIPIIIIFLIMGIGFWQGWHEYISLSSLIRHRAQLAGIVSENFVLAILIYVCIYIGTVAFSFPGASFLTISGGFLFGWHIGGIFTVLAATCGASIIFLAAKTSFGKVLREKAGPQLNRFSDGFQQNAFNYLLFLRLVPVFPFWFVNIAPALFNIKLGVYIVATIIGILPGTFVYSYIGAGLDSVIVAQERSNPGCSEQGTCGIDINSLVTPELIIAIAGLGVLAIVPVIIQKIRNRKSTE